jgi:hypothetical protein
VNEEVLAQWEVAAPKTNWLYEFWTGRGDCVYMLHIMRGNLLAILRTTIFSRKRLFHGLASTGNHYKDYRHSINGRCNKT